MEFNLNDQFKVILNHIGMDTYKKYWQSIDLAFALSKLEGPDKNELTTELWHIIQIFGKDIRMGYYPPFLNNRITFVKHC